MSGSGHGLQRLTPDQERIIREAWAAGVHRDEVCRRAGITIHVFAARRLDQLRDLPPRQRGTGGRRDVPLPSPVEIKLGTFEVRKRWDEDRWLGLQKDDEPPLGLASVPLSQRGRA